MVDRARGRSSAIGSQRSEVGGQAVRPPISDLRPLAILAILLWACLCGPSARGQDDWDVPKKAAEQPAQGFNRFALPGFDQWVLRGRTNEQLESTQKTLLTLQIDSVARACELSADQREKLQLAGQCDIKRLSREVDALRERFRAATQPVDQQKYSELINEGSAMQGKLQSGIYGDSSLFQKVLAQTLSREQRVRYERQERQRRQFRYQAKIELILSNLEGSISLDADQRQKLVKLLVDGTEPPRKFGQYDTYVVLFQLGKLDEAKLRPILDESQRKSLKRVGDNYRGMEQFLRQQGYLP